MVLLLGSIEATNSRKRDTYRLLRGLGRHVLWLLGQMVAEAEIFSALASVECSIRLMRYLIVFTPAVVPRS